MVQTAHQLLSIFFVFFRFSAFIFYESVVWTQNVFGFVLLDLPDIPNTHVINFRPVEKIFLASEKSFGSIFAHFPPFLKYPTCWKIAVFYYVFCINFYFSGNILRSTCPMIIIFTQGKAVILRSISNNHYMSIRHV